jgi:hypothetical protein
MTAFPDVVQCSVSSDAKRCAMAKMPPPSPARNADSTKAVSLYRWTG